MKKLFALIALFGSVAAFAADVVDVKVKALDGFGGDTGAVSGRCQTKVGAAYDPETVRRDVTTLKDSGEFEDISVDAQRGAAGVTVTFYVKRKFRYQAPLVIVGCDFFSEGKISGEAELKDGYLYGEGDLAAAAAKVRLAYQKKSFFDAKVTPIVEPIPGGNNCTIKFVIVEGARRKIAKYRFAGATVLRTSPWWDAGWWKPEDGCIDEKEVRDAIGDYPWWNPVGWFTDSPVTEDQQAQCAAKIEEVYRNHGYLDVSVKAPTRQASADDAERDDIVFAVTEGSRYTVGTCSIKGLTKYPEDVVRAKSALPPAGSIAGAKDLDDAAHRVMVTVGSGDLGLADTRVDVRRIPRSGDPTCVDLVFVVKEGVPVVIDDIVIRGNDYTKDKVIRREISLGPGDRMLEDRAERGQKRLENLNYFSRVRYYLESSGRGKDANGAEYRNLVYEVEEQNTGSFMVGLGASSVDSVYLSAAVTQSNFDLFAPDKWFRGAGQKARALAQWGPRYQTYEVSVTEPHLFDRVLELTVEGHRRGRWYDDYDIYRTGAGVDLSYPVKFGVSWLPSPFGRFGVGYTPEFIQMDDVESGTYWYHGRQVWLKGNSKSEESLYGDAWEHIFEVYWARDGRDNFRMPTTGSTTRIGGGVSVGDNEYWRLRFNHRHYFPVWKRFNHVLMAALRAETIEAIADDVPIYDRMFLGGPRTIRGVEYRNVSPFATRNEDGHGHAIPWGGQTMFCMNFEYTVPIVKMFRMAIFSDLGSVGEDFFDLDFDDTFAWTVGIGARIDIPMFPIRLDFATPIEKPDHADEELFSFTIGYDF